MDRSIVISLAASLIVLSIAVVVARGVLRRLGPAEDSRSMQISRLTSEHLHRLAPSTWRLALEIDHPDVPDIDQIVIGPYGVLAIDTVLGDRPALDTAADDDPTGARATATAALARAPVDALVSSVGVRCHHLVLVYWGTPQTAQPAAISVVHATVAVDGRRLGEWIRSLPDDVLSPAQIDLAWQAVTTGIGRPDPLPPDRAPNALDD